MPELIEQCRREAQRLPRENLTPAGILRALDREKIDARHPVRVTCAPRSNLRVLWRSIR